MKNLRIFFLFVLAGVCFGQARDAEFNKLADRFFDEVLFRFNPVEGTAAGFHQYDALLPSGSRAEIDAEIAALKRFEAEVRSFDPRGLSPGIAADRELVLAQIQGQLLELETIRPWEKDPDQYSSGATNAIFTIMSRSFAPPAALAHATRALELAPQYHDLDWAARHNGGRLVVSETFVIAQATAATTRTFGRVVANLGWYDIELPQPVHAGDTIEAESTILETRASRSRAGEGIVCVATRARNQAGDTVLTYRRNLLVYRHGADNPYARAGY